MMFHKGYLVVTQGTPRKRTYWFHLKKMARSFEDAKKTGFVKLGKGVYFIPYLIEFSKEKAVVTLGTREKALSIAKEIVQEAQQYGIKAFCFEAQEVLSPWDNSFREQMSQE